VFSRDGSRIYVAAHDHGIRAWDSRSGKEVLRFKEPFDFCGLTLWDETDRVIGTVNCSTRIWDGATGELLLDLPRLIYGDFAISPNGSRVIAVEQNGTAGVWDTTNQSRLFDLSLPLKLYKQHIYGGLFLPDSGRIVTGSSDNNCHVWTQRRPEAWWGLAWLPEFWCVIVFGVGLIWSIWRDQRSRSASTNPLPLASQK
jgi:WD40 repeat protein